MAFIIVIIANTPSSGLVFPVQFGYDTIEQVVRWRMGSEITYRVVPNVQTLDMFYVLLQTSVLDMTPTEWTLMATAIDSLVDNGDTYLYIKDRQLVDHFPIL